MNENQEEFSLPNPPPESLIDSLIGKAILLLRGDRTQRFVAKKAGVPTGTWCQWEKGRRIPRAANRLNILQGLGCTQDEFDLAVWQVMTHQIKGRGSELATRAMVEPSLFARDIARLEELDLETLPESARPSLRRMRHILGALCVQIQPLLAEYEALFIALNRK